MKRFKAFIAKEKETLSRLHGKQKLNYIWDYYKIPIIAFCVLAFTITYSAIYSANKGKTAIYVVLVNAYEFQGEEYAPTLFTDMMEVAGYDTEEYHAQVDQYILAPEEMSEESAATIQVLAALFSMGDMDLFAADAETVERYAYYDGFEDLSMYLTDEFLETYSADLYTTENSDGKTVAVGIICDEDSLLLTEGYYSEPVILCIPSHAEHLQLALDMIEMILSGKVDGSMVG